VPSFGKNAPIENLTRNFTDFSHSFTASSQLDKLEQALYPPLAAVLGQEILGTSC